MSGHLQLASGVSMEAARLPVADRIQVVVADDHGLMRRSLSPSEKPNPMPPDKPLCAHCGVVIGAYEPMILVENGKPRKTSASAEQGREPHASAGERYHAACYTP